MKHVGSKEGRDGERKNTKQVDVYIFESMRIELEKRRSIGLAASDRLTRADKTKEAILFTCNPRPREDKTQEALGLPLPPTPPLVSLLFRCTEQNIVLGLSHTKQNIHTLSLSRLGTLPCRLAAATVLCGRGMSD